MNTRLHAFTLNQGYDRLCRWCGLSINAYMEMTDKPRCVENGTWTTSDQPQATTQSMDAQEQISTNND